MAVGLILLTLGWLGSSSEEENHGKSFVVLLVLAMTFLGTMAILHQGVQQRAQQVLRKHEPALGGLTVRVYEKTIPRQGECEVWIQFFSRRHTA